MGSLKIFFLLDALAMGLEFCRKNSVFVPAIKQNDDIYVSTI
jgi:hypothetical protein